MRVLDMCAAPGGKTTMLAEMMRGTGTVMALDRTLPKVHHHHHLWHACVCKAAPKVVIKAMHHASSSCSGWPPFVWTRAL